MLRNGDDYVHFTKMRGNQLSELRTVLDKRPKGKFSLGLSPEAQEAMQETVIEQNSRRGKRGSKGNVLFSDTVRIRTECLAPISPSRQGPSDGHSLSPRSRWSNSRRGSLVSERRGSLNDSVNALDQVEIANKLSNEKKWQEDRRGTTEKANEKCLNLLDEKRS